MLLLRLLYKPFAIMAGIISGKVSQSLFKTVWSKIDDQPPPKPGTGDGSTAKVVGAQALQAGVVAGVAAVVDRAFARVFHHLIGIWPKKPPAPEGEDT
jgi:hypothetical protein